MDIRIFPMQTSPADNPPDLFINPPARYVRFGTFDLDLQRQELLRGGQRVAISRKVFEVLLILIERSGNVVTREALRARLWPPDSQVNYDANVNTTVNKLRQVLGDSTDQPTFVETIPRRGYSFIAKTEYLNEPSEREARAIAVAPVVAAGNAPKSVEHWNRESIRFAVGAAAVLLAGMLLGLLRVIWC